MFDWAKKLVGKGDMADGAGEPGGAGGEPSADGSSDGGTEEKKPEEKKEEVPVTGDENMNLAKLSSEIIKMKASMDAFGEVRKSFSERFSRMSEQIGELRSMILERDRSIQEIELKAVKAYDLVDSVHPEKISAMVQREDAKIEAVKANLEGDEAIMERLMDELKEMRKKIAFFRGVEEIIKLSEEVKAELIEIKKIESKIGINTDKVETIYSEMRNRFQDLDNFSSDIKEMKVSIEQNTKDAGFLKDKVSGLADKAELEKVVNKVQRYIDALKDLEKKSSISKDVEQIRTLLEGLR